MDSANERRRSNITSSLIGWAHAQNDPFYTGDRKQNVTNDSKQFQEDPLSSI